MSSIPARQLLAKLRRSESAVIAAGSRVDGADVCMAWKGTKISASVNPLGLLTEGGAWRVTACGEYHRLLRANAGVAK